MEQVVQQFGLLDVEAESRGTSSACWRRSLTGPGDSMTGKRMAGSFQTGGETYAHGSSGFSVAGNPMPRRMR